MPRTKPDRRTMEREALRAALRRYESQRNEAGDIESILAAARSHLARLDVIAQRNRAAYVARKESGA